jgi:hypothetical protein
MAILAHPCYGVDEDCREFGMQDEHEGACPSCGLEHGGGWCLEPGGSMSAVNRIFNWVERLSDVQHTGVLIGIFLVAWGAVVGVCACVSAVLP